MNSDEPTIRVPVEYVLADDMNAIPAFKRGRLPTQAVIVVPALLIIVLLVYSSFSAGDFVRPTPHGIDEVLELAVYYGVLLLPWGLLAAMPLVLWFLIGRGRRRMARRWLETMHAGGTTTMTFSPAGLEVQNALEETTYQWEVFEDRRELPHAWVFFLMRPLIPIIIPKRVMPAEEWGRVLAWADARIAPGGESPKPAPVEGSICLTTRVTWSDYRRFNYLFPRLGTWNRIITVLLYVYFAHGFYVLADEIYYQMAVEPGLPATTPRHGSADLFQAAGGAFIGAMALIWLRRLRRGAWLSSVRAFGEQRDVEVSSAGVVFRSAHFVMRLSWPAITHVVMDRQILLFCHGMNRGVIIPRRDASNSAWSGILALVARHLHRGASGFPVQTAEPAGSAPGPEAPD